MKKLITILLVASMCLFLVACGGNASEEKAIVGEWKRLPSEWGEHSITFYEGGTGLYGEDECSWKYDNEKECYVLTFMLDQNFTIEVENDLRYFEIVAGKYYHIDDYEKAVEANK